MITLDSDSPRTVPLRKMVPNLITTASLCSALVSINYSLKAGSLVLLSESASTLERASLAAQAETCWKAALMAVGTSAVFDTLDGRAARLLKATSRFGAVYDSLTDFLAFGVAPALLLHQWMLRDQGALGIAAVVAFVMCSALRLARFTSMPRQRPTRNLLANFFVGLPTPAAAGAVLIPVMLDVSRYFPLNTVKTTQTSEPLSLRLETASKVFEQIEPTLVVVLTFLLAALMISKVPLFSFKKVRVQRAAVVPIMAAFGFTVFALWRDPYMTISVLAALYVLSVPLSVRAHRRAMAEVRRLEQTVLVGVGA